MTTARAALRRAYSSLRGGLSHTPPDKWAESRWQATIHAFGEKAQALNRRIRDHNLKVPHAAFHCPPLDVKREIKRLTGQDPWQGTVP